MKTAFFLFILFPVLRLSSAQAGWDLRLPNMPVPGPVRIPTIGEVVGGVQKVLPVSPQSIECDRVRDDANRYQKQYAQDISRDITDLQVANAQLASLQVDLKNTERDQTSILNQEELLQNFQTLAAGLNANEGDLRATLLQLQGRWGDPVLRTTVDEMAAKADNVAAQQLAVLLQSLMNQSTPQLKNLLEDPTSSKALSQLSALIAVSQAFIAQEKGNGAARKAQIHSTIESLEQKTGHLSTEIATLTSEVAKQEARKSCKF
jgi:hypothetical protein